jgi:ketosteroid isomerase-like protein
MTMRRTLMPIAALVALCSNGALAQLAGDLEGVKAASKAFFSALEVLDDGAAMEEVWANTPYVTFVGPRSKAIIVGWEAQKEYWIDNNKRFSTRQTLLLDQHIHVNGNLAWEMGLETGENTMKDGRTTKSDFLVTNVYEKQPNGRWLIVSHHAQPKPQ